MKFEIRQFQKVTKYSFCDLNFSFISVEINGLRKNRLLLNRQPFSINFILLLRTQKDNEQISQMIVQMLHIRGQDLIP